MWQRWRPAFAPDWDGRLCPILFADQRGLMVVMRRASQPVTPTDFRTWMAHETPWPDTASEPKPDNLGWLDGRIVELDYGIPLDHLVAQRRKYLESHAAWRGVRVPDA
jgi:hypothetical protein